MAWWVLQTSRDREGGLGKFASLMVWNISYDSPRRQGCMVQMAKKRLFADYFDAWVQTLWFFWFLKSCGPPGSNGILMMRLNTPLKLCRRGTEWWTDLRMAKVGFHWAIKLSDFCNKKTKLDHPHHAFVCDRVHDEAFNQHVLSSFRQSWIRSRSWLYNHNLVLRSASTCLDIDETSDTWISRGKDTLQCALCICICSGLLDPSM